MSALFVRQSVYIYEFLIHCLTKCVEVFMQIYIICHPLLSFQSILYATRYIVLDDICVSVILLKCLKRAYRFIKCLCHGHFWINAFPSRKFFTMSSLLTKSPGIPGVTLCFCTGSYAAAAGRRVLFTRYLLNNFSDFLNLWSEWWTWPIDYLIRFCSIFVVTLTLNFQGQIWNSLYLGRPKMDQLPWNKKANKFGIC